MKAVPLVTAVIPTRNRPEYVLRAIYSVLEQSYTNLEVVVVIDGPDPATSEALAVITDPRVRVIGLVAPVGGSEVRNVGVREAQGTWIALLDDDDEWMPDKIKRQVEVILAAADPYRVVASKMIMRYSNAEYICPRRLPKTGETMSDYLFIRKGISHGDGFIQTSSFFASKQMFLEVPFRKDQKIFQDTDWLLRVDAHQRSSFTVIDEPLVVYYMDHEHALSRKPNWEYLHRWGVENRKLFTDRAYSFFIVTQCIPRAAKQKEPIGVFTKLLRECLFDGSPTINCVAICFFLWFVPQHVRQRGRDFLSNCKARISGVPPTTRPAAAVGQLAKVAKL